LCDFQKYYKDLHKIFQKLDDAHSSSMSMAMTVTMAATMVMSMTATTMAMSMTATTVAMSMTATTMAMSVSVSVTSSCFSGKTFILNLDGNLLDSEALDFHCGFLQDRLMVVLGHNLGNA
jgi:hypothetical protein